MKKKSVHTGQKVKMKIDDMVMDLFVGDIFHINSKIEVRLY